MPKWETRNGTFMMPGVVDLGSEASGKDPVRSHHRKVATIVKGEERHEAG